MTQSVEAFGDLVRTRRVGLGLTQEHLAERAGVSPRSLRSIENGRTTRARASTVRLLAEALELAGPDLDRFRAAAVLTPVPAPAPAAPGRLPPDLPDYTGNAATVADVSAALTASPATGAVPAVVIAGQGGVGKTSLAVHVAHLVSGAFPDGQVFVSFRGTEADPASTAQALARALRGLGDDGDPGTDLDAGVDRYRERLAGRRILVVLDDATGAAQVRPFLPSGPGSAVLVSTRARLTTLAGVRHVDLGLLAEADAIALLERIVGAERIRAEPDEVRTLVRQCARLPLALRVVGARLAARPHWKVGQLVTRMSDERRRLDELAIDDLAVRAGLAVSYRGLSPLAQRALRMLACLDPPDFAAWTPAALLDLDLPAAEDVVEELLDTRLIEVVSLGGHGTRYRMHDLVRIHAREQAQHTDTEDDLRAALGRAVRLGLHQAELRAEQLAITVPRQYRLATSVPVHPTLAAASQSAGPGWFEAEEPSLVSAVEHAAGLGMDDLACALADALVFTTFAVRNEFIGWNRAHAAALAAARSSGNLRAEAVIECGLGQLRYKEDRFTDAKQHFERALTLFRRAGDDRGEIIAMNGLGTVCRELGEHQSALALQGWAGVALGLLGDDEGAAHAHYGIGFVHRELGDDVRAIVHLGRAKRLYRKLGHVRGEAIAIRGLGLVHRARGELDLAETLCAQAHALTVGSGDRLLTSYTGQALAKVWIRQGTPARAREPLAEGLVICGELRDRLGIALIRRTVGELHLAAGDPVTALDQLTRAHREWQALDHELWQARTLRDLGAAHAALGDEPAAHRAWAEAGATFQRFGTRERTELTAWRQQWGCTCAPETLF